MGYVVNLKGVHQMSRRVKIDRRCAVDRHTVIETIRFVDYPGIPEEFVSRLIGIKKFLEWVGNCIEKNTTGLTRTARVWRTAVIQKQTISSGY